MPAATAASRAVRPRSLAKASSAGSPRSGPGRREFCSLPTSTRASRSSIERSRQRAILAGDNSERPLLRYFDPAAAVKIGDRIVTSGEGGVFPPGLPVGVVASVDGEGPRGSALCRVVAGRVFADRRLWARRRLAEAGRERPARQAADAARRLGRTAAGEPSLRARWRLRRPRRLR